MIITATRYGSGGSSPTGNLSFTGSSMFETSGDNWEMHLFSSGTLKVKNAVTVDICMVAGGKPGNGRGGNGGAGGEVKTVSAVELAAGEYTITIGGSNENTVIVKPDESSLTAETGGGSRGSNGTSSATARNGVDGVYAWGAETTLIHSGWKYGAGGGIGAFDDDYNTYSQGWNAGNGGSVGSASEETTNGHGGTRAHKIGYPGLANTGQGGGGGEKLMDYRGVTSGSSGGEGGSGAVMIRDART